MAIQTISSFSSNSSSKKQIKTDFENNKNLAYNKSTTFKSESDDEKREAIKKQIKKIYTKGFITGAILTAAVCIFDYLGEYLVNKHFNKLDTSILNETKDTEKIVTDIHIPFRWILGKFKK